MDPEQTINVGRKKIMKNKPKTIRPFFVIESSRNNTLKILKEESEFDFYSGFSYKQKLESIKSFHTEIHKKYPKYDILEVSTKSEVDLGRDLSAFNLKFPSSDNNKLPIEIVFQSSKVFEKGSSPNEIIKKSPKEVKKIMSALDLGNLIKFKKDGIEYPTEPKTIFYDWLYVQSLLYFNKKVKNPILKYNIFTDINFNPKKSTNCQAFSVAVGIVFIKNNIPYEDIIKFENYERYCKELLIYDNNPSNKLNSDKQNYFNF